MNVDYMHAYIVTVSTYKTLSGKIVVYNKMNVDYMHAYIVISLQNSLFCCMR